MTQSFFDCPILNSPYEFPARHWELDKDGQPTNQIIDARRHSDLTTPVPNPKKRKQASAAQTTMSYSSGEEASADGQEYNP